MDKAEYVELYKQMVIIRLIEEKCEELYQKSKIGGFMHLYIGQEASGVGAISARQPQDNVITAYRDHGIAIACGMDPKPLMAEMLGKVTGCCKGKGGSMHLADINLRFWGGHAIVGAHLALATGLAWADKQKGSDGVTLCFFGDGASNIGYFHESLNLAAVWKLPVLFICENNHYGMWTPVEDASAVTDIRKKALGYDIPSDVCDGMDLLAVRKASQKAIAHIRSGKGPFFLEVMTYRYRGHSMGDQRPYRTAYEIKEWQTKDPIGKFEPVMIKSGITKEQIESIHAESAKIVEEAVRFAEESPFPPMEELYTDIYVENQ